MKKANAMTEPLEKSMRIPKDERDYEAESAFDTIMRAQEHMDNPEMMKRVMKHAKKRKKMVIKSMDDLKAAAAKRRKELSDGPDSEPDSDVDD